MNATLYEHVRCKECNGILRMQDSEIAVCGKCGAEYELYKLDYNNFRHNNMTGWTFPVKERSYQAP